MGLQGWRENKGQTNAPQSSVPGSQFSVLSPQSSVLSSWFLVLGSRFLVLGSWFLVLSSQFLVLCSRHTAINLDQRLFEERRSAIIAVGQENAARADQAITGAVEASEVEEGGSLIRQHTPIPDRVVILIAVCQHLIVQLHRLD